MELLLNTTAGFENYTTNATTNATTNDLQLVAWPQICIFAIIIFIGVLGNGLLILTVAANKNMYTVPNIFLVSLAIGDLAVILLNVPLRMLLFLFKKWVYGVTMCRISEFTILLSQGVSIFTLTALAGDRFVAIVFPMQTVLWSSKKKAVLISLSIWLFSFLLALPDFITSDVLIAPIGFEVCMLYAILKEDVNNDYHPYILSRRIINFVCYFVLPLLIISTFYISIAVSLHRTRDLPIRDTFKIGQSKSWAKQVRARKKIAMMILVITLLFVVCWAPRHIFIFLSGYHQPPLKFYKIRHFKTVSYILSFLNSCVNPPSLYFMSADFKRYFNQYLFGRCCKSMRISKYSRSSVTSASMPTHVAKTAISFEDLALT